ncbi:MAG: peptidyl-arginine deiminase [Linnemannia elongata]|nr:MAG: peptidyl-arginine deiminase [Linnemannia elongata]
MTTTPAAITTTQDPRGRRIPAEWEPHQRIIMAWPTHWESLTPKFQGDVARVAQAVSRFESVQMLVPPDHIEAAKAAVGKGQTHEIEFLPIPVNDLWARDFIPLFMTRPKEGGSGGQGERELVGVDYNFNGWGQKAAYNQSTHAGERLINHWNNTSRLVSRMIAEGGAIENDGQGTLLMTESSIVNDNRNPNKTRSDLEETFKEELGVKKVIWLKGLKGYDITDSHIDALARFVAPGVVVISKPPPESQTRDLPLHSEWFQAWRDQYAQAIQVLSTATDAKENSLRIIELPEPNPSKTRRISPEEVAAYVNFLIVNGGVVMAEFGDEEADAEAKRIVEEQFPGRKVETVRIDYLVKGGGGIHCSTHDVPIV